MKILRGLAKDIVVQVEKFYYLMDFVVLDIEPLKGWVNLVLIILRRSFLAMTNALINYKNDVM